MQELKYRMYWILLLAFSSHSFVNAGTDPNPYTQAIPIRMPLQFIANAGQWNAEVRFGIIRGEDKAAFTREGIRLYRPMERPTVMPGLETSGAGTSGTTRMLECSTLRFINPSPKMRMEGIDQIETHTNFYRGNDSSRWRSDVPTYGGVRYVNAWDGVDVEYVEHEGKLRQRIIVHEGANPDQIAFANGNLGEQEITPVDESQVRLSASEATMALTPPPTNIPYRNFFEKRKAIETEFNTFFGRSGIDGSMGMDEDQEGNIHIAGVTTSSDFPVYHAYQSTHAGGALDHDYFVTCLSGDARTIIFSTFLGGSEDEWSEPVLDERLGTIWMHIPKKLAVGDNASTHIVCNTQSIDFPHTSSTVQAQRYDGLPTWRSSTALVRFSRTGTLDAATWLGGPTFFGGETIRTDPSGNVFLFGLAPGEQWFITPGSLQTAPMRTPSMHDTILHTGVLVKLTPNYSSVLAATYLLDQNRYDYMDGFEMEVDNSGDLVLFLNNYRSTYLTPGFNEWYPPVNGYIIAKIDSDLSRYVFTTGLGGAAEISDLAISTTDEIIISGITYNTNPIALKNPISNGPRPSFVVKFPTDGKEPVFSTRLPIEVAIQGDGGAAIYPLDCGDIVLSTTSGAGELPKFVNPLDTHYGQSVLLTLDPTGQSIVSLGYWHLDEKYVDGDGIHVGGYLLQGGAIINSGGTFIRNGNLTALSGVQLRSADSVSTLRAFQSKYAGGENDMFLYRTRLPGCEMLSCSVSMADSVRITHTPPRVDPVQLTVTADVLNIHPTLLAGEVECVLSLPPGLILDPPTQSLRKTPPAGQLASGASVQFSWTVKVDTSKLSGQGIWVDVVTYYHNTNSAPGGPPSSTQCDHYIAVEHIQYGDLELACSVDAPDRLTVNAGADGYDPTPFSVRATVRNVATKTVDVARFIIDFGGDIGGVVVPLGERIRPGKILAPGEAHSVSWLPRAERRAAERTMRVMVTGEDANGLVLSFCETEVIVPALKPLLCAIPGPLQVFIPEDTSGWQPDPIIGSIELRQVLDTILLDARAEIDLSSCRYLQLAAGEMPVVGPLKLGADALDTLHWELKLASIPVGTVRDTIIYRWLAGGGRWIRTCSQEVFITPFVEGAACSIAARDSLTAANIAAFTPVYLDFTLENTGTVPMPVEHYDLSFSPGGGLRSVVPLRQNGETLAGGTQVVKFWELQGEKVQTDRLVRCTVTAYGPGEMILAECEHTLWIEATDGVISCALTVPDRIRFDRDSLRYQPNPFSVLLELTNPFDVEETNIEAELDLTLAPRCVLASGEPAVRTLQVLGKTEQIAWTLVAQAAPVDATEEVIVRYRSDAHPEWSECRATVTIEAWPEIAEVHCATGGHDSLHADAKYEEIIPKPFEVSYTATNSGTVTLTNCTAAIILPAGFAIAGSDSIQSFGTLAPSETAKRWWTLTPSDQLSAFGPYQFNWQWSSDEQGTVTGCAHTVQLGADPPGGIVFTPLHLYFEAELGGALPQAQSIQLWTGGGLSMPWTAQSDTWYIDIDPVTGDHTATIAVRPNTTMLNKGMHSSAIELAGSAKNLPKQIEVEYLITSLTSTGSTPAPSSLSLGPVYPHPIPLQGEARIVITPLNGSTARITLHDLLGRERAVLHDGVITDSEVLILRPAVLGLEPGSYLLRLLSSNGMQSRMVTVVR
ncbi:MAG: hypothetical protein WAV84_08675 [Bacteroidota bacterium]